MLQRLPRFTTRMLGAMLLALVFAVFLGNPPAHASNTDNAQATVASSVVMTMPTALTVSDRGGGTRSACSASFSYEFGATYLPINRWGDATGTFHHRLGAKAIDDVTAKSTKLMNGWAFSFGNFLWRTAANFLSESINFCALESTGAKMDAAFAEVGQAVMGVSSNGTQTVAVIGFIIAFSVIGTIFSIRRGNFMQSLKKLIGVILVAGILSVMTTGALNSQGPGIDGADASTPYTPGFLSPGWFVTNLNSITSSVLTVPARALGVPNAQGDNQELGSCASYVDTLNGMYWTNQPVDVIVSQMWVKSGVMSWANAQYGDDPTHSQYVYCHQLEEQAGISARQRADITNATAKRLGGQENASRKSLAFSPENNIESNRNFIALAACAPQNDGSFTVRSGWDAIGIGDEAGKKGGPVSPDLCAQWWSEDRPELKNSSFEFKDNSDIVQLSENGTQERTFLNNLFGYNAGQGQVASMGYVISGIAALGSFGLLAVALFIGKITQTAMVLILVLFLIMGLFVSNSGQNKAAQYAKTLLGVTIFVNMGTLVVSFLALVASILADLGTLIFSSGTLMSVLWIGLSPVAAVFILTKAATQAGIPSPFKLGSAIAFGAAAGQMGGSAASSMDGMGRSAMRGGRRLMRGGSRGFGRGLAMGASRNSGRNSGRNAFLGGMAGVGAAGVMGRLFRNKSESSASEKKKSNSFLNHALNEGTLDRKDVKNAKHDSAQLTRAERAEQVKERRAALKEARARTRVERKRSRDEVLRQAGYEVERNDKGQLIDDKGDPYMSLSYGPLYAKHAVKQKVANAWPNSVAKVKDVATSIRNDPKRAAALGLSAAKTGAAVAGIGALTTVLPPVGAVVGGVYAVKKGRQVTRSARDKIESPEGFVGRRRETRNKHLSNIFDERLKHVVSGSENRLIDRVIRGEEARGATDVPGANASQQERMQYAKKVRGDDENEWAKALDAAKKNDERRQKSRWIEP